MKRLNVDITINLKLTLNDGVNIKDFIERDMTYSFDSSKGQGTVSEDGIVSWNVISGETSR